MQCVINEFEALQKQVLAIDPQEAGSLGHISRMKASVDKCFEQDRIPLRERRILLDELRMIQRRAVGMKFKVRTRSS